MLEAALTDEHLAAMLLLIATMGGMIAAVFAVAIGVMFDYDND